MAGDWLKFEINTPEKPEVLSITVDMGWDDPDLVVGKLLRLWRWFDQHTENGNADNVTLALLDRIIGVTGFCEAVAKVGWLIVTEAGIELPNFERHNGKTAKNRALTAKRVANHKSNAKGNDKGNAASVTSALPREEKRREDIYIPPNPQGGEAGAEENPVSSADQKAKRERKPRIQLKTFLEQCRQAGEPIISEYRPLLEYVEACGLPMDMVQLCWDNFKREFLRENAARLQADWRRHFLNYITKNYYRLWYVKEDGTFELTSQGRQAKLVIDNREAA